MSGEEGLAEVAKLQAAPAAGSRGNERSAELWGDEQWNVLKQVIEERKPKKIAALPLPRSVELSRNVSDAAKINATLAKGVQESQRRLDQKIWTQTDYNNEMAILNSWRKAAAGSAK